MKTFKNKKQRQYKVFTVLFLMLFALGFTSCSDEFLDAPEDKSGVNSTLIFSDRTITQTFISGILSNYKGQYGRPDAGGIYSIYFARAVKGNDLIQGPSWYSFDYAHENREAGFRRTNFSWSFNYENVNFANILIDGVTKSATLSPDDKKEFIAQGKFFRGLHLFELLLDYAPNFKDNQSLVRIPVYNTPASIASIEGNPPVALSVVMDQIKQDLTDAIQDLSTDRPLGKSYVNKAVAQAVMTRVLAVTQDDWATMSSLAKAAYGGNANAAVVSSNWGNGFNNMGDDEWLWALFQNGSDETNFFWGHAAPMMDHLTLSYRASYFDPTFVAEFSTTDVRNTFSDIYGVSATTPWREFISTKYAFTFDCDIPILRKSEMVLFDAEAQYHLGNETGATGAQGLLFALQSARDSNAVMSSNTGQALLDEILLERKKEFYGEFGPHWFDTKRYNLPIVRSADHRVPVTVPANSDLFFLKIPQTELDNNPGYEGFNNI